MKKRHLMISLLMLLLMAFLLIPTAGAIDPCAQGPGPGVDWSGCNKTNQDFTDADLSNMILVGTNFTGSIMDTTNFSGSDLTSAIMQNMATGTGVIGPVNFSNAQVQGLDLTGNTELVFANFEGSSGVPILPASPPAVIFLICPNGDLANYVDFFCSWVPTAVTLLGMSVVPDGALLPYAAVGVMGLASGLLIAGLRRRRETAVA